MYALNMNKINENMDLSGNLNAIEINSLTVAYDTNPVLWDINLEIPRGNLVAILGPNGAGKSTLIKSMMKLVKPVIGRVDFPMLDLNNKINNKIAYVPQSGSVDWDFPASVLDVVLMGRYGHLGLFKRPKQRDKDMALDMLKAVGMEEYIDRQINKLSGGQQQRVFIARALIQQAEIYFLDEPFKGVDVQTEKIIIKLLKELRDRGKTVIVVHHDLQTVEEYFDWATLINVRVIANGRIKEVFNKENLDNTYVNK